MRITGGRARGVRLESPRGLKTRPAADSLREALFSSLSSAVEGKRFADLFAGTGSYGLEAISRGADSGVFVEKDSSCLRCLKENSGRVIKSAEIQSTSLSIVHSDVFRWGKRGSNEFDLVFADPPYTIISEIGEKLFSLVDRLLVDRGIFVLEKPGEMDWVLPDWKEESRFGKKNKGPSVGVYRRLSSGE